MQKTYAPQRAYRSFGKYVLYLANGITEEEARELAAYVLGKGSWQIIGVYRESKVSRKNIRTELRKALAECKERKCKLIVPKMAHLTQNINFINDCFDYGIKVLGLDLMGSEEIQIGLLKRISDDQRKRTSVSVRKKHAELKKKGIKLGSPSIAVARQKAVASLKEQADTFADQMLPIIKKIEREGATSLSEIANRLNDKNVETRRGGRWTATSVRNIMRRR